MLMSHLKEITRYLLLQYGDKTTFTHLEITFCFLFCSSSVTVALIQFICSLYPSKMMVKSLNIGRHCCFL
ncbi:hypothetical protein CISIN_1g046485mg [Citrus sinensis]|uniref:Uncharacterized protein n=1 Tax=Citrus sinensis TaxID=2711 RepID=A0A067F478_CITSI|nr:hypothetical protein CISIN_1g046485mg [Citrus sinensis]